MRKDENSVLYYNPPLDELAKKLKADGFELKEIKEKSKRTIIFGLKTPLSEENKAWLKRENLLLAVHGNFFIDAPRLLEFVNRESKKSKDENIIRFFEYRTAEDIIKLTYLLGKILQYSIFITETLCSWIQESKTTYLIDLGKALEEAQKKTERNRLSRVQTFPYVLMNRAYFTLMEKYPVTNPTKKQDEVLLRISKLYKLKNRKQVKEILFDRAPVHRYVSPFERFSDKEAKVSEWQVWEDFLRKKTNSITDKRVYELVAKETGLSNKRVRRICQEVKSILGIKKKSKGIKSDAELNKIVEEHLSSLKRNNII